MPAVTVFELTLRNSLSSRSIELVGRDSWEMRDIDLWIDARPSLLLARDQLLVDEAKARLTKRKSKLTPGRLIAELDLGFWTGLFDSSYEHSGNAGARLWPHLRKLAFPGAPKGKQTRGDLAAHFHMLRALRNSVVHHKHFWRDHGLLGAFDIFASAVGWMNRSAQIALTESCRDWVRLLEDRGSSYFEGLAIALSSSEGPVRGAHRTNPAPEGDQESMVDADDDELPF
jgi:hypothetical protein